MTKTITQRRRRWPWVVVGGALLLVALALTADRLLQSRAHSGLRTFLRQWAVNYPASFAVEPELLEIHVEDADFEELTRVVEEARARGVILPEGNTYVPAVLEHAGSSFKGKLRIKGKLTDHVEGSKWSFRVIAKKDGGFLGMRRFSLQHPGTRNYLCDWFYHRLMAAEGVVALRYGFIRVRFNGEDRGIYALEEHFGPELLERNGRLEGPIFRFDPALFWEHRLNEMNKLRFEEPFAAYQAASLDAFGSSDLEKDKAARGQFEEAVALMDAFRRGQITASDAFDVDRLARHHAVLDLIGGHHSMDWSDVKFYYDPLLKRIEPISYESFSGNPIRNLAGSGKWAGRSDASMDLHTQWFNDEALFRAYIRHLERVSREGWLDSAFIALKPALDSASATLYREFPYKELDRRLYYKNQQVIRKLLHPPKPFHAYLNDNGPDTVRITIVPIEALPMEVHALVLPDRSEVLPFGRAVIPIRASGKLGNAIELRFAVKGKSGRSGLKVSCSVLGASLKREVEVFPHALLPLSDVLASVSRPIEPRSLPWLVFDDTARTITIKPGSWQVESDVVLPLGYRARGIAPLKLEVAKGARLTSLASMDLRGHPESPLEIVNHGSIVILQASSSSQWSDVRISGSGRIVVQETSLNLSRCEIMSNGEEPVMTAVRSKVNVEYTEFSGGRDGVLAVASNITAKRSSVLAPQDDAFVVRGGTVNWSDGALEGGKGVALKLGMHAECTFDGSIITSSTNGVEVREGSVLRINRGRLNARAVGVLVKDQERIAGPSLVELSGVALQAGGEAVSAGEGNKVSVDGSPVDAERPQGGMEPKAKK
ncbi:MAG: CotH kinase family protein [Flavobacteriales bacterium]|nr:CotH kinase family protein [Flavobacteriales bacterium]